MRACSFFNSYDAFKLLALATMLLDHVGHFIYPEEVWLRAIGRASFPIWLFLAGYGARLPISPSLVLGALATLALELWHYDNYQSLNILFSILIMRIVVRALARIGWLMSAPMTLCAACIVLVPATFFLWDYGTQAILFGALGYYRYHQLGRRAWLAFAALSWAMYVAFQAASFQFAGQELALILISCTIAAIWMVRFEANKMVRSIQFTRLRIAAALSRHSLEFYVLHLAALMLISRFAL